REVRDREGELEEKRPVPMRAHPAERVLGQEIVSIDLPPRGDRVRVTIKIASSAEPMGAFRLRQLAKVVQEGQFRHGRRSETVGLSGYQFDLVVQTLYRSR